MLFLDILNFYIVAENQCFSSKFYSLFHSAHLKKSFYLSTSKRFKCEKCYNNLMDLC